MGAAPRPRTGAPPGECVRCYAIKCKQDGWDGNRNTSPLNTLFSEGGPSVGSSGGRTLLGRDSGAEWPGEKRPRKRPPVSRSPDKQPTPPDGFQAPSSPIKWKSTAAAETRLPSIIRSADVWLQAPLSPELISETWRSPSTLSHLWLQEPGGFPPTRASRQSSRRGVSAVR